MRRDSKSATVTIGSNTVSISVDVNDGIDDGVTVIVACQAATDG